MSKRGFVLNRRLLRVWIGVLSFAHNFQYGRGHISWKKRKKTWGVIRRG